MQAVDKADKTPLAYAAARGHSDIAALLLDHGAEIEAWWHALLLLSSFRLNARFPINVMLRCWGLCFDSW